MKHAALLAFLLLGQADDAAALLKKIGLKRGIIAVVQPGRDALPVDLARSSELLVYAQVAGGAKVQDLRRSADEAGFLGTRVYFEQGSPKRIHLADNLADAVIATADTPRAEVLRVLRPGGRGLHGGDEVGKAYPEGADEWTHPYHGPDNNPQSKDQVARGPFLTQFMATPWYGAMPQMSVMAGGRIFKVWGNRTSAQPQWDVMDTLLCTNAWNGTELWRRKLSAGFMIQRNTMIATAELLYLGDDVSCKRIDAATGGVRDEIVVPDGISDGPVWKWMALEKGILYALVGEKEKAVDPVKTGAFRGAGWPWWKTPDYAFGFGRTVLAIDAATKKVLWSTRDEDPIDSRAMCMSGGRIFIYSHKKFMGMIDAATGKVQWKSSDEKALAAIGEHDAAQHWMKGYSASSYAKMTDKAVYFAGPQRTKIAAVSAADGKLLWEMAGGNSQLIVREDALYCLGEGSTNNAMSSYKLHPTTGEILAKFPSRDRCTRATGSAQFIFTRGGKGGSTAAFDVTSAEPRMGTISPMRPACHDGVVVANGLFYWGPWMCRCDGTQIGVISLGSGGAFDYAAEAKESERLEGAGGAAAPLAPAAEDWPTFRKDNARSTRIPGPLPAKLALKWESAPRTPVTATAPVTAGGLVFAAGADGSVRAIDAATGKEQWKAYTGGDVKYPPAIADGRAFVGSGDGCVYCYEAASGKLLWRFRAAPADRKVPLFGSLSSTWPVGSGVLVHDGVAYAAAGNANLDGTHVYALEAATGKIRWQNHTSGHLEGDKSGAGVQGHLLLHDGAIWMAAGNLVPLARYDLKDGTFSRAGGSRGKDLYVLDGRVQQSGVGLYWRPEDWHYIAFAGFALEKGFLAVTEQTIGRAEERDPQGRPRFLWNAKPSTDTNAVILAKDGLLVAGVDRTGTGADVKSTGALAAISLTDGKILWKTALPGSPSGWGLARDKDGRYFVSLQDGRVLCFAE
ncbi:MAG: PQQ-binding-like beta-propeller repeat protein [Planctomycetes bacterium]|nr:PQQ-binding-like beta-propeller repeat protein [Planctomycetota bacterium]